MAIDKIKPLKIENPSNGGTQTDPYPTETNPAQDYLSAKGLALEGNEVAVISGLSGVMNFQDSIQTSQITLTQLRTAINNTFNNSTNGFVSTNVQAAIEEARNTNPYSYVTSTTAVSTSSTTYTTVTGMSITPVAGTYLVIFNTRATTTGASAQAEFALFNAGTRVTESTREVSCNIQLLGLITISLNTIGTSGTSVAVITVNGSQAIDTRFRSVNGGSITFTERNLTLLRIG